MPLTLHSLHPQKGATKSKQRVGRGLGSKGTYSGRGIKGQKARSGVSGLQKLGVRQLMLATPKMRGFTSGRAKPQIVNIGDLSKRFPTGTKVTPTLLEKHGFIPSSKLPVKILGTGAISIAIILDGCLVSASARKKIEEAGGRIIV